MVPALSSRSRFGRVRPSSHLSALVLLLALPWAAGAVEMTLQNDSVTDFSQVAVQVGFASNEQAAVWLTSPCDGDLVAVQIFWRSLGGGTGGTVHDSIRIHEAGTFPVPGTLLQTLVGPLLQDGFLNEFRFLDKGGTVPLIVPVVTGQVVVVSFRFDIGPSITDASVVTDVDGCQAGKNGILAIPPGSWFSSCALGVSGDFVIRAVVDCSEAPVVIFIDGFESGDTSAWTNIVP